MDKFLCVNCLLGREKIMPTMVSQAKYPLDRMLFISYLLGCSWGKLQAIRKEPKKAGASLMDTDLGSRVCLRFHMG